MAKSASDVPFRLWLLVACLALVLGGCVQGTTTKIPHETSTPPEKNCTLNIHGNLTVKQFDGKDVHWTPKFGDAWVSVQIPEGSHTFVLDYNRNVSALSGETHYQQNMGYTYDGFVAGRTYEMVAAEGAEEKGFLGMFDDIVGTMVDTAQRKLTIIVKDVTGK